MRTNPFLFSFLGMLIILQTGCSGSSSSGRASDSSTSPGTNTSGYNQRKIAVGLRKAFAIDSVGAAKSWGENLETVNGVYGQIGQGFSDNTKITTPQLLDDPGTTYVSITSGEIQSCGLTSEQKVKCWGSNIGDGTWVDKNSPTSISDTTTYIDISSGAYHNCGVTTDNVMKCWGDGWQGKLGNGDGSGSGQASPVEADAGTTYTRVAAGLNHTCGITTTASLKCWGTNSNGQVGDGTTTSPRLTPLLIDPGVSYSVIAAGDDSTCGITTGGILKCWGLNSSGQLGDNSMTRRTLPTVIDPGVNYSKVSVGGSTGLHTCGITTAGVLKCWGNNSWGQLGNGGTNPSLIPVVIDSGTSYSDVSANGDVTCGITTSGILKCWGDNSTGELGLGNTNVTTSPAVVGGGY